MNNALFRGGVGSHLEGIYAATAKVAVITMTAPDPGPVCRGAGLGEFNFVYHVHLPFEMSLLFFTLQNQFMTEKIITLLHFRLRDCQRVTPRRLKSADAPAPVPNSICPARAPGL